MATFVLVHGAWCWRRVARLLVQDGHDVCTPTLTGVAERSHLLTPDINLDTHILDVVNEMKWQELENVVLVGHSYGGMVISGVAEKMENSISSFVMLDASFLKAAKPSSICSLPRSVTLFWLRNALVPSPSRHGLPRCSMSTKWTARGWTRSARRIRSNAFCKSSY